MSVPGATITWDIESNLTNLKNASAEENGAIQSHYSIFGIIFISVCATFLSLITVIGNCMVMISFKIDKQLQTISNYFLFSLAVADFMIGLVSMPLFTVYTVLGYWPLGPHICDSWLALDYLVSNASVLNLLIISFDRYFSVISPLTYRAKRTNFRAGIMIAGAWGISLILWPPWIYAWPYIEGQRTVPDNSCYIQFIETNHYITFGTAIAAFYVPVTVMCILYWRIWRETKKRQKDLAHLQGGNNETTSRRSNSGNDDLDEGKRQRSESSTVADELSSAHLTYSSDRHYQYRTKHRTFSWTWLKMWCIAWWHSGREEEDEDVEVVEAESSRIVTTYDEALTPLSADTPLTSVDSQCPSISHSFQSGALLSDKRSSDYSNIGNDSVYTILITLPSQKDKETARIKMISEGVITYKPNSIMEDPSSSTTLVRRPSNMMDMKTPLNVENIPRATSSKAAGILGKSQPVPVPKKKKKVQEKKADKKAAKTLSAILLAFILTWTPYNILVLLKPLTACEGCIPQELWDFFYYLCYINSTVNPMCYALGNATFRRTYVRILKCKWHSRTRTAVNKPLYS